MATDEGRTGFCVNSTCTTPSSGTAATIALTALAIHRISVSTVASATVLSFKPPGASRRPNLPLP
jgi:hypothetical protein